MAEKTAAQLKADEKAAEKEKEELAAQEAAKAAEAERVAAEKALAAQAQQDAIEANRSSLVEAIVPTKTRTAGDFFRDRNAKSKKK